MLSVPLHAARQLPSWLIFDVRQKQMSFHQLTSGYLWFVGIYSVGSILWLMFRHRGHINFKSVQAAMSEKNEPDIPGDAQSRWNKDATIVGRISIALVVGWLLIMFFGRSIAGP